MAICALTSWTAWYLYALSSKSGGLNRWAWILQTAVATGSGIWATHFIAMLAFKSPLPAAYDAQLTLASLIIAIIVTGLGFGIAGGNAHGWRYTVGGLVIGIGIATMHYTGMVALSISGRLQWDMLLAIASIMLGICFATASLWVFEAKQSTWMAAALLATAICVLHFTAMAAVTVQYDPTAIIKAPQIDNTLLVTAIAAVTLLVLLSGLTAALINLATAKEAQQHISRFRHLACTIA